MWIALSLGGTTLLAGMLLLFVPAYRAGAEPSMALFYLLATGALCNLAFLKLQGIPLRVPRAALPWIVAAAVAIFLGNVCYMTAIRIAPNPGFPGAIEGTKTVVVTLSSVWLFAAHFSWRKGLGVLCCTIGVTVLCL